MEGNSASDINSAAVTEATERQVKRPEAFLAQENRHGGKKQKVDFGDDDSDSGPSSASSCDASTDSDSASEETLIETGETSVENEDEATSAETGETSAETGETSAETGETSAETGETSAETGETSAETGETSAETGETSAETGETSAETGETSAETGETSAETGETSAETGETSPVNDAEKFAPGVNEHSGPMVPFPDAEYWKSMEISEDDLTHAKLLVNLETTRFPRDSHLFSVTHALKVKEDDSPAPSETATTTACSPQPIKIPEVKVLDVDNEVRNLNLKLRQHAQDLLSKLAALRAALDVEHREKNAALDAQELERLDNLNLRLGLVHHEDAQHAQYEDLARQYNAMLQKYSEDEAE